MTRLVWVGCFDNENDLPKNQLDCETGLITKVLSGDHRIPFSSGLEVSPLWPSSRQDW